MTYYLFAAYYVHTWWEINKQQLPEYIATVDIDHFELLQLFEKRPYFDWGAIKDQLDNHPLDNEQNDGEIINMTKNHQLLPSFRSVLECY
jgi:hypothetical protein